MRTEVRTERLVLTNGVLHEVACLVHMRVDNLTTGPLVSGEWSFVDIHDLEPGSHEMILLKLIRKRRNKVADHVLGADFRVVNMFEGLRD